MSNANKIGSLLLSFVVAQFSLSAHADAVSFAAAKSKIIARIQKEIQNRDLRRQGPFDPFKVAQEAGLIASIGNLIAWTGEGGDQLGILPNVKDQALQIDRRTSWVNNLSYIYCDPSVVTKSGSGQTLYYDVPQEKQNLCMEIGVQTSLDATLLYRDHTETSISESLLGLKHNYLPDFSATVSLSPDGRLNISFDSGGKFTEKVYIWDVNPSYLDRQQQFEKANALSKQPTEAEYEAFSTAEDAFVYGKPIAEIDQGSLPASYVLKDMKNVSWGEWSVPSLNLDLAKAQTKLSDLSPVAKVDGERTLNAIRTYQDLKQQERQAADKAGLFGTQDFQNSLKKCKDQWQKTQTRTGCEDVFAADKKLSAARNSSPELKRFESPLSQQYSIITKIFDNRMSQLDKDPSFLKFLIDISQ